MKQSWKTKAIGDAIETARTGFASGEDVEYGVLQIRMNNIANDGAFDWTKQRRVPAPKNGILRYQAANGDVLFNQTNSPELVGKSAFFPGFSEAVTFSNHFICLSPREGVLDGKYLSRWLHMQWRQGIFKGLCKQWVNQATVSKGSLLELEIPLPPLDEQKRIAAILDQADDLRRKRLRAIERLGQLGQALFVDMFGDPATNPKGFERLPLGNVVQFVGGAQPAKSHFLYEDGPDRVRFIQTRDFRTDKYPTYVPKALAKRPFTEDDVMIGRYGPPVFQIFRGLSGTYNVALMKARPRLHLNSDFIYYLLQEPKLHSYVVGNSERPAGQSGVNLDLLEKYPCYAPPEHLIVEFSHRVAKLSRLIDAMRLAGRQSESLFSSLQNRAFRGEL